MQLRLSDFSGGLNKLDNLKDNEASVCENVIFNNQRAIEKRPGYKEFNVVAIDTNPIKGLYIYHKKNGERFFIATSGADIYLGNETTGVFSSIKTGLALNKDFTFTTLGDICYMANGFDNIQKYDGVSVSVDTNAKIGKYIVDHKNHLFLAGSTSEPSIVYFYELADTSKEQGFSVGDDDGDIISGLIPQMGNLVIFKTSSISILYGDDPDNFNSRNATKIQPAIGCISPRSIVNIENYIYFLANDGVRVFDGTRTWLISKKVKPIIDKIGDPEKVSSCLYDGHYFLSFPEGSSLYNNAILAYNYLYKSWTYFSGINASVFNNYDGSQDGKISMDELYFGDNSGKAHRYDDGATSDNGNSINMKYTTKEFNLNSPYIVKTFRKVLASLEGANVNMSYSIDQGTKTGSFDIDGSENDPNKLWGANWGDMIWSKTKPQYTGKSLRNATGKSIKLSITSNDVKNFKLKEINIDYRPKRERWK